MVDLPQIPRRLVTTEAPTSPVTADAIAAPYASLGRAFEKLGGALDDVSMDMAKDAGRRAVTLDDDGNLQVQQMPPLGRAAEAFNRTAQMTYIGQLEPRVKDQVMTARTKFGGNPQAFLDWAEQYGGAIVSQQPSDDLAQSVRLVLDRHVGAAYQGLTLERHQQDVSNNRSVLKRNLDSLDNDLGVLAREGGTDSEEYKSRRADYTERQRQAMTDPSLNYPKAKADADLADMATRHEVWGIIGNVRRIAEIKTVDADGAPNGGVEKAKSVAESILTSRSLNLDQETREKYYKVAVSEIKQLSAENRALISTLNTEGQAWAKSAREGNIDAAGTRDFLQRAADAGATKAFALVSREVAAQTWYRDWFSKLPAADRAAVVSEMSGVKDTRSFVDRAEQTESGGNPNAQSTTSSAAGSLGFTKGTWLGLIRREHPELAAKSDDELLALRSDRTLSREMGAAYAKDNSAMLSANGIQATDRNLYVMHHLGPKDGIAVLTAPPDTPVKGLIWDKAIAANQDLFARNPTAGAFVAWAGRKMGEAPSLPDSLKNADNQTKLSFLSTAQRSLKSDLKDNFATIEKTINSGVSPSRGDMDDLGAMVHAVGDDEQKQRVLELGAKAEFGDSFNKANPTEREAMLSQLRARYAAGGQKFVGELSDYAGTLNQRVTDTYRTDPYGASVQFGQRPVLPPVSPQSPDSAGPALQARVPEQSLIRDQQGLPAFSALRPAEADAWKNTLTSGDVRTGAGFLYQVMTLPTDVAVATMTSKPMADGIKGMVFSRDPSRMEVGLTALDRLWRTNPTAATNAIGSDAIDRMQVWQGLRDSFSPTEVAERINIVDDPSRAAAREQLKSIAEKETDKMSPADVASKFATGIPGVRAITGGAANVPTNDLTAQQLMAEYKNIRTALRTYGVDGDKAEQLAFERLGQSWGVSGANGNQVMKYPPEKYYPAIGGSHAWLNDEVKAAVESMIGPRYSGNTSDGFASGPGAGIGSENWSVVGLAPAPNTAARLVRGSPPAYSIVIKKRNGELETVVDRSGRSAVTFDPKSYVDRYEADMRSLEPQVKSRTSNFGIGQGYVVGSEL